MLSLSCVIVLCVCALAARVRVVGFLRTARFGLHMVSGCTDSLRLSFASLQQHHKHRVPGAAPHQEERGKTSSSVRRGCTSCVLGIRWMPPWMILTLTRLRTDPFCLRQFSPEYGASRIEMEPQ
jgi:hypothetical protein